MEEIRVTLPDGRQIDVPVRTRTGEIVHKEKLGTPQKPIVATLVNNELTSLSYRLEVNASLKPITLDTPEGTDIYRRTLCFVLAIAARNTLPGRRLVIGHSLGDAYYYSFDDENDPGRETHRDDEVAGTTATESDIQRLEAEMRRIVSDDRPILRKAIAYGEAIDYFRAAGQTETELLLRSRNDSRIWVYACGEFLDLSHAPLLARTGLLEVFGLEPYAAGFLLRFPHQSRPDALRPSPKSRLLFSIYQEYKMWGKVLGVSSVGRLNQLGHERRIKEFIWVADALHNKKISEIADKIDRRGGEVRAVLIAGPSSSGKTTFAKKLAIQLTVLGFRPVPISLDDFFVPREQTPRDESGNYDFESIEAIDVALLNETLLGLFRGDDVASPVFDFKTGQRSYRADKLLLPARGVVILEGIHGLNEQLTPRIPREQKFKIYVSALTQLNLDDHNRIATTDNRLIRRLVRDYQFRGHSATATLDMWPAVRRGEDRNIFPFQESADAAFNSALDYELGVLRNFAEPLLHDVKPNDSKYNEALRLLSFLTNFLPIPSHFVPDMSILREFIGESAFKY